jgi:asparagine synthase (glutamine-hydrolysing)
MCGITGFLSLHADMRISEETLQKSNDTLQLRGPDCKDVFFDGHIGLGHRRLSIIDTSATANQPMSDASGRYVIVFNGEIFNYRQLADQYLAGKWNPSSHSDTEVLLYLLIHYQTDCLSWLSGFFAFAFYDKHEQTLLLGRDRFGKKPLVYYSCPTFFAFASEIKALFAYGVPRNLNYNALFEYLQLSYTPPQHTMFEDVVSLPAGHWLKVAGSNITIEKYYEVSFDSAAYQHEDYQSAQEHLYALMDEAVKERMIADVPLGAFLSGGIDSSTIVALASKYTKRLKTFSIGYTDHDFFDETAYAKLVADKYQTDHTVFYLGNKELLSHVDKVLDYFDQPLADPSCIPLYILCEAAKKEITVALTGDGADEIFGGYNKHMAEYRSRNKGLLAKFAIAGGSLWKNLPQGRNNRLSDLIRQLNRFAEAQQLSAAERYWRWASINPATTAIELLHPSKYSLVNELAYQQHKGGFIHAVNNSDLNGVFAADVKMVLAGNMLPKTDLMSMANSLELRSPFLSHKVVDYAFTLPPEYKVNGQMKKRIVQDTFRNILPKELYNRPKHGFDVPMQQWFRHELKGRIFDDLLAEKNIRRQEIFNYDSIKKLKAQLFSNNPGESVNTIWALVVFQYWYNKYFA